MSKSRRAYFCSLNHDKQLQEFYIMNNYLSSSSLKAQARGQLLGKYRIVICIFLLHLICIVPFFLAVSTLIGGGFFGTVILNSVVTFLFQLFVGFFIAGEAFVYLKVACNQTPVTGDLFHCFRNDSQKVVQIQVVLAAISVISAFPATIISYFMSKSFLGILLGVPSGDTDGSAGASLFLAYVFFYLLGTAIDIFAKLLFSQVYYLMLDFPEYSAMQLLKNSILLMKGNKGRLFYIQLSFIPLLLLGALSFGIGFLWLFPYMEAVSANFYLDLINKRSRASLDSLL